jgi:hypothetical protein
MLPVEEKYIQCQLHLTPVPNEGLAQRIHGEPGHIIATSPPPYTSFYPFYRLYNYRFSGMNKSLENQEAMIMNYECEDRKKLATNVSRGDISAMS